MKYKKIRIFGAICASLAVLLWSVISHAADCSAEYKRSCYSHWIDADRDGQNTREEILELRSFIPVTKNSKGKITAGLWLSQYDGTVHSSPGTLDLDHIIALGHVHRIGGADMTPEQRRSIANDPLNLELVTAGSNRQKSDHSGTRWIIPNLAWLGDFIDAQEAVRVKYGLGFEPCEQYTIKVEQWVADHTTKGIRLFRAEPLAMQFKKLWDSGVIADKFQQWEQCQEAVK